MYRSLCRKSHDFSKSYDFLSVFALTQSNINQNQAYFFGCQKSPTNENYDSNQNLNQNNCYKDKIVIITKIISKIGT